MINWTKIAATVKTIAGDIAEVAPLAAVAGPEGAAIGALVAKAAQYTSAVVDAATAAGAAVTSTDLATITAANASVEAQADALSEKIAES